MTVERDRPRAHLVVDDFFSPSALERVLKEVASLDRRMKPGLVRDIGHDGQSVFFAHPRRRNRAVWVHESSPSLRLFREHLWAAPMLQRFEEAREPLFQIIPSCWAPHLQVSSYMTGDHYDFHEDEGAGVNLTAIVFLAADAKKVRGGDLVLAYGGERATVRFRHNRLVIFPSKTLHRVTRVRVASTDPKDARISLQCWLSYGRPPARPKRRAPEVDRPTFLLAEEPILAAAQTMVDSPNVPDTTPESLYWGALYLSRILSSNLRFLGERLGVELRSLRIRRRGGLEVYGRARLEDGAVRIGFRLAGPEVAPSAALSLFVEGAKTTSRSVVPPGADERETVALLRRLLSRSSRSPRSRANRARRN